ncbi:MAG: alkaline phosphatase family protein [Candidatus Marinimicrobia bacterium]|jgi:alkaline phosphatase D|nr:alkaline phosphatase family protein [Candidatus Neomarinimicrobiota bacterium]MBT3617708.1 alkaline phosphatase family protein [Candidatus Neomarinimicrobiota bacterium]MBT3828417.1 alkaline phosphatase family protein [Candidatus Neomarinimicrobiota bacterium]MBT3997529.1 alkaline phosphatase family protein [Candidatus Neomarinimicrobiota bacterium]MBT4280690.1 alkaline phosphatase family protein [Candidatus Neomarinimicrobiota bacterium]
MIKQLKRIGLCIILVSLGWSQNQDFYVLMISMDGFRADYLDRTDTPNFDKLANDGVKAKSLKPIFVSKTFPNHYSLATGMYAENHGLIGNSFYAPDLGEHYSIRDRSKVEDGRFYGGEPIWMTAENQGLKAASFYWVGSEAKGQRPSIWKRYDQKVTFEARVDSVMKWFLLPDQDRPRLIMLYFHEPDWTGHGEGPKSSNTLKKVQEMDAVLGSILKKAAQLPIADKLNIIVTSDHGMAEVSEEKMLDISKLADLTNVQVEGSGPKMFISSDSEKELNSVYSKLQTIPHMQVFYKKDIPDRWHYRDHVRIPDILVVADEGWWIKPLGRNSYPKGDHGYDNELKSMHAIFVADGPAFKDGYLRETFANIHVYPLVAHILGLTPYDGIDGNLDAVRDLLRE